MSENVEALGPEGLIHPPEFYRPPWADPSFILATNLVQVNPVTLPPATTVLVAGNNPRRWAVGFSLVFAGAGSAQLAPWNDPNIFQFALVNANSALWFWLFQYGPLVTGEWYARSAPAATMRVLEVMIN